VLLRNFNSNLPAAVFSQKMQERMRAVVMLSFVPVLKKEALDRGLANVMQSDVDNHIETSTGTGFLISPQLLLTCHHVLPHRLVAEWADISVVFDFDAADQAGVQRGRLLPAEFVWTDPELDATVVAFSLPDGDAVPRPPIALSRGSCKHQLTTDGRLCILGHPNAEFTQVSLREGFIKHEPNTLTYSNDTMNGSSGSPVFTVHWQAVAVHVCAAIYKQPSGTEVTYNEGSTVSAVVEKLTELYNRLLPTTAVEEKRQLSLLREALMLDLSLPKHKKMQMQLAQTQLLQQLAQQTA
jgi:hypothetical protein